MENACTVFNVGDLIWTTKDGRKIKYRDLDITHIKNIAKKDFVRREISSGTVLNDMDMFDYDEYEVSYAKEMETELLRRTICKTLNINI